MFIEHAWSFMDRHSYVHYVMYATKNCLKTTKCYIQLYIYKKYLNNLSKLWIVNSNTYACSSTNNISIVYELPRTFQYFIVNKYFPSFYMTFLHYSSITCSSPHHTTLHTTQHHSPQHATLHTTLFSTTHHSPQHITLHNTPHIPHHPTPHHTPHPSPHSTILYSAPRTSFPVRHSNYFRRYKLNIIQVLIAQFP